MTDTTRPDVGTLAPGVPHPAAASAMRWFSSLSPDMVCVLSEALATSALGGDERAIIATETFRRLMAGEPVSDRYLLGLCWTLRDIVGANGKILTF